MAIYSFSARILKRSQGKSAVGAAAYRAGDKYYSEREEKQWDYSQKAVVHSEMIAPPSAGEWSKSREEVWNRVQAQERQWGNGQLARDLIIALPRELAPEEREHLVREFARRNFVDKGMIADINIHEEKASDGKTNPHAHIMLTMKPIDEKTGDFTSAKNRTWNSKKNLNQWRENWATAANDALEKTGSDARIDHRTLAAQGIDKEAGIHVGSEPKNPHHAEGYQERLQRNHDIRARNAANDNKQPPKKEKWDDPAYLQQRKLDEGLSNPHLKKKHIKREQAFRKKIASGKKPKTPSTEQVYARELKRIKHKEEYQQKQEQWQQKKAKWAEDRLAKNADFERRKELRRGFNKIPAHATADPKRANAPPPPKPAPKKSNAKSNMFALHAAASSGKYAANKIFNAIRKPAKALFQQKKHTGKYKKRQEQNALSISWKGQYQKEDDKILGMERS